MCGRYVIVSTPQAIRQLLGYEDQPNFPPRYNIAPTQPVPIVRIEEGRRRFALVRWGLIPSWVKDSRTFSLVINARGESVNEKPAFRNAMRRRRCLFPADGFYEWKRDGDFPQPYFVRRTGGGPVAFAGLWEVWAGPDGEEVETAAIVTTTANRTLAAIHDRMPVVLAPDAFDFWLDPRVDARTATALIAPAPENAMELFPVSAAVNRVTNDHAGLIEPVDPAVEAVLHAERLAAARPAPRPRPKKDDGQASLF